MSKNDKSEKNRKIVCLKWTERIICGLMLMLLIMLSYIVFFVGSGSTYVDDICYVFEILLFVLGIVCMIVRGYYEEKG